jgi:hypothetical protein
MARLLEAFHIFPPSYLISALSLTVRPPNYKWLTRIHLDFTIDEYFEFFGISTTLPLQLQNDNDHLLRAIDGLRHLELFFRKSYGHSGNSNIWTRSYIQNRQKDWFRVDTNYAGIAKQPCQKAVIQSIMTFAFPSIKDIRHIHLAGDIQECINNK